MESIEKWSSENSIRERAFKKMEFYVENCVIYIDTCSLLFLASAEFFENIEVLLTQHSKQIYVISGAMQELEKHALNSKDIDLASSAQNKIKMIEQYSEKGLVKIVDKEGFVDNVFLSLFTTIRMEHSPLLITQDKALANDILNLNVTRSVKAHKVRVARINQYGCLSEVTNDNMISKSENEQDIEENIYRKYIIVHPRDRERFRTTHWEIKEHLKDMTWEQYVSYCRFFLTEKIYELMKGDTNLSYGEVLRIIDTISDELFDNLTLKTNRILAVLDINVRLQMLGEAVVNDMLHVMLESLALARYDVLDVSIFELSYEKKLQELGTETGVDFRDIDEYLYTLFSFDFFVEKIAHNYVIMERTDINHGHIFRAIMSVDSNLYLELDQWNGKVTLVNEIIRLFRALYDYEISKDMLLGICNFLGDNIKFLKKE